MTRPDVPVEPLSAEEEAHERAVFAPDPRILDSRGTILVRRLFATIDREREARTPAADAPRLAELRAAVDDIRLLAHAILGGTSYQPHREAAERVLALMDPPGGTR